MDTCKDGLHSCVHPTLTDLNGNRYRHRNRSDGGAYLLCAWSWVGMGEKIRGSRFFYGINVIDLGYDLIYGPHWARNSRHTRSTMVRKSFRLGLVLIGGGG